MEAAYHQVDICC